MPADDPMRRDARLGAAGHQTLRVRVLRVLQDLTARTRLDDVALVHHDELLGSLGGEAEVVRDEDARRCRARS